MVIFAANKQTIKTNSIFAMKQLFTLLIVSSLFMMGCTESKKNNDMSNPFFVEWDTPFGVPPFDKLKNEHYMPAFKEAMKQHKSDVNAIIKNAEAPTFANTLVAMDKSGTLLTSVNFVFDNLTSADTNDELQDISKEVSPLLSAHYDDINLNPELFNRVKAVYDQRKELDLGTEQKMLLEKVYKNFVRGGAELPADKQEKLREYNKKLSLLSIQFGENVLNENKRFQLIIEDEKDLAGLPDAVIAGAKSDAETNNLSGKWLFTINKPSMLPFLTYAENRDLREKIFMGYIMKGDNNDSLDNKEIVKEITDLRIKRAGLFGFNNHAEFTLDNTMAKTPDNVYEILTKVWEKALPVAKKEAAELQKMIYSEGEKFTLKSWDWWYYSEKVRVQKFDLSEDEISPYFEISSVRDGIFELATRLWGIKFIQRNDLPVYNKDVVPFEVTEADGTHIGIFYTDFYVRPSKRGGAWMSSYVKQEKVDGKDIRPVITNVCNFPRPTSETPSLLSMDQVNTMFHEFGHGLHGLLSNCEYITLSGTSVARDFVELPSQIMENWAFEPEMLKIYAKHYKTGEPMPQELIEKIKNASYFNKGFETIEFLAAGLLDMDWHTLNEFPDDMDVRKFETKSLNKYGLIDEIVVRYRSTYFQHIFSGGYSSGYYSYLWAEVLDADGFNAFKEADLFDKDVAAAYRKNILEKGGSEDPMELYVKFRGHKPQINPLLQRRGLVN